MWAEHYVGVTGGRRGTPSSRSSLRSRRALAPRSDDPAAARANRLPKGGSSRSRRCAPAQPLRASASACRAARSSCSRDRAGPASRRSRLTPSTRRVSAATSNLSSAYARQFLEQLAKPDVERIEGLSPAIAIEQRPLSKSPRSTVGTVTEIADYLRLLYSRVGVPHCPQCGKRIEAQTVQQIVDASCLWRRGRG